MAFIEGEVPLTVCIHRGGSASIHRGGSAADSVWVVRVGGDDGQLPPWHHIYVYSIESRLTIRARQWGERHSPSERRGKTSKSFSTFTRKQRPESGRVCLMCVVFVRERWTLGVTDVGCGVEGAGCRVQGAGYRVEV